MELGLGLMWWALATVVQGHMLVAIGQVRALAALHAGELRPPDGPDNYL